MARHTGYTRQIAGIAAAVQSALIAGSLLGMPAWAQNAIATVSAEMAEQKARMLESFFDFDRLAGARDSNPDAVRPLETEARARLAAGSDAVAAGQFAEAMAQFDAGIRAVSQAVALGASARSWGPSDAAVAFVARRRQANTYLEALERSDEIGSTERREVERLRGDLGRADAHFLAGALDPARETLDVAYGEIVTLVSEVRRGHSAFVARVFASPHEEFAYEQERHRSYRLLVEIALAERGEDQPGLIALAARLSAQSDRLRAVAEQQGETGDYPAAIGTMERATERLLVALRAAGLIMME